MSGARGNAAWLAARTREKHQLKRERSAERAYQPRATACRKQWDGFGDYRRTDRVGAGRQHGSRRDRRAGQLALGYLGAVVCSSSSGADA